MILRMANPVLHYLRELSALHKAGNATEHSFRPALQALITSLGKDIDATNEPRRIACGAPDFIVQSGDAPLGYIECKDLGMPLDAVEKSEQMTRYLDGIDNLVLTNYLEFRYYLNGEMEMQVFLARLPQKGRLKPLLGAEEHLRQLFDVFFSARAEGIADPIALAERLARVAQIIRDAILAASEQEDATGSLHSILEGFRQTLLRDITHEQFADMYAQTVCYGMFSGRVNVPDSEADQFSRRTAAIDLPATNPFLREVFEYIAGTRLNTSVVWAVDLLADILRRCDMAAVLRDFGKADRREDPVVHFYESFLAAYDPSLRESRGVYYTPEPVVNYIVRSVDAILKDDFACPAGLADNSTVTAEKPDGDAVDTHRVQILDPATGTGTFLYETVRHIYETLAPNRGAWAGDRGYVAMHLLPRLHGFELMMAPYAVAHMKLGWLLKDTGYQFPHNERLRVYLTNTLDEAGMAETAAFPFADQIAKEANAARNIKTDAPIMVVLGNPPYSGHSANNNEWSKALIKDPLPWQGGAPGYFHCDSEPLGERNPKWLNDDYVKFIRFGQYRVERTGYGVLAFITNHGYLDNPTFRGMRQSLMQTFDDIYLIDLHGNVKKRETVPDGSKDENVFDIQQGVSIGIFVRKENVKSRKTANVFHTEIYGKRQSKYDWLNRHGFTNASWDRIAPQSPFYLFKPQQTQLLEEYQKGWNVCDIMPVNSVGIVTARDKLTIQFTREEMWDTVRDFGKVSAEDAREKYTLRKDVKDWKVVWAQEDVNASSINEQRLTPILYRPFDERFTYYTGKSSGFLCRPRHEVMRNMLRGGNLGLCTTRSIEIGRGWEHVFCSKELIQHHTVSLKEVNYLFPLYVYPNGDHLLESFPWPAGKGGRRPNLTPEFVKAFEEQLGLEFVTEGRGDLKRTFGPEDVFHYAYAIFHSPIYRSRYAAFLKGDFPRLPLTSDTQLFARLCALGAELTALHLLEDVPEPRALFPEPGDNIVVNTRYAPPVDARPGRVYINDGQYFEPVPPEVWEFQIGGYQVCAKWLKDRKGRVLDFADIERYRAVTEALRQTLELMRQIDHAIPAWPIA